MIVMVYHILNRIKGLTYSVGGKNQLFSQKEKTLMYIKQIESLMKLIEKNKLDAVGLLIQLDGLKAQLEMDLDD